MAPYRLFGDLWLSDPSEYLNNPERNRLTSLEPHLCALDERLQSANFLKDIGL